MKMQIALAAGRRKAPADMPIDLFPRGSKVRGFEVTDVRTGNVMLSRGVGGTQISMWSTIRGYAVSQKKINVKVFLEKNGSEYQSVTGFELRGDKVVEVRDGHKPPKVKIETDSPKDIEHFLLHDMKGKKTKTNIHVERKDNELTVYYLEKAGEYYSASVRTDLGVPDYFDVRIPANIESFKKIDAWLKSAKYMKPPFARNDGIDEKASVAEYLRGKAEVERKEKEMIQKAADEKEAARVKKEAEEAHAKNPATIKARVLDYAKKNPGVRVDKDGIISFKTGWRSFEIWEQGGEIIGHADTELGVLVVEEGMQAPTEFAIKAPLEENSINELIRWTNNQKYSAAPFAVRFKDKNKWHVIKDIDKHIQSGERAKDPLIVKAIELGIPDYAAHNGDFEASSVRRSFSLTRKGSKLVGSARFNTRAKHGFKFREGQNTDFFIDAPATPSALEKLHEWINAKPYKLPPFATSVPAEEDDFEADEFEEEKQTPAPAPKPKPAPRVKPAPKVPEPVKPAPKPPRQPKVRPTTKPAEPIKQVRTPAPRVEPDNKPPKIVKPDPKPTPTAAPVKVAIPKVKPATPAPAKAPAKVTAKTIENLGIYAYGELGSNLTDVMKNTFKYKGKGKEFSVTLTGVDLIGTANYGGKKYAVSLPASVANLKTLHKWAKGKADELPPFTS